jgi:hypothetical protein
MHIKLFAVFVATVVALLLNYPLRAQVLAPHGSAAEARQDAAGYDPVKQDAQRKTESTDSTAVITETKGARGWDSAAGKKFMSAIQSRKSQWPDFDQIVFKSNVTYSEDMMGLMAQSPYAADIAYYLGIHPHESSVYAGMPLEQSTPAIHAVEEKVKSVGVKTPVEPVRP